LGLSDVLRDRAFYLERFFKFDHRTMMSPALISLLDKWVREAVARHGDDWPAIMACVEEHLGGLGEEQRTELSQQITLILASRPVLADPASN
jgi:hypothetical protein